MLVLDISIHIFSYFLWILTLGLTLEFCPELLSCPLSHLPLPLSMKNNSTFLFNLSKCLIQSFLPRSTHWISVTWGMFLCDDQIFILSRVILPSCICFRQMDSTSSVLFSQHYPLVREEQYNMNSLECLSLRVSIVTC